MLNEKDYYRSSNVTVAVLNFNGVKTLADVFNSIYRLNSRLGEVIMVDDGSSDNSVNFVRQHFPEVRIVEIGYNSKFLNMVRNIALKEAKFDFVLIIDNDVTLKSDCLDELLSRMKNLPNAAVCMPRTLFEENPEIIYQDGQTLHYIGATPSRYRNLPINKADNKPRISIGWGVKLIDRQKSAIMGNFNENYIMGWGDDGEFDHKMNLAGYLCYHIPSAVVYHKRVKGAHRYYGTIRNRWRFLLEFYQWKTLILCAPAFLVYELSLIFYLLAKGRIKEYFKGIYYIFTNIKSILNVRRYIQEKRKFKDSEMLNSGYIYIDQGYVNLGIIQLGYNVLNYFLMGYWFIIRKFI